MHIKLLYRKVLYVFLSLAIVIAPAIQQANAASSWSITSAVSAGSRTVVSAKKSGYKSAVNIAPTAGRLALKLGKGANWAALVYAAIQLAPDLADIESFQPDYANNRVKYKIPVQNYVIACSTVICTPKSHLYKVLASTPNARKEACKLLAVAAGRNMAVEDSGGHCIAGGVYSVGYIYEVPFTSPTQYIPIPVAAVQVIKNANAGHAASQAATRETATEMVIGGQFDQDLLAGAVPTSDTRPLVPSVPGNGNGNVTHGSDVGIGDDGISGATPGQQADAAKDAADASKKAAQAAADAAKAAAEDARKAADDAKDLINSGADQAAIDAANDRAKAAEQAAADSKGAADAATKAAAERARAAEAAADRARIDADARAKAAEAAADSAIAAEKAAAAADKAAAKAAADAAIQAAERARAEADARAKSAEEAAKAADRAKAEAAKPFELPAFCTWAAVVCDYTVWVKEEYGKAKDWVKEEPVTTPAEMMPIDDDPSGLGNIFQDKAEAGYVSFESSCPADVLIPVDLMGASQTLTISYTPFCHFASLIRYAVILGAWISGLLIVTGGRSRE